MREWEQRDNHKVSHIEVWNRRNIWEEVFFSCISLNQEKRIQTEGRLKPKAGKHLGGRQQEEGKECSYQGKVDLFVLYKPECTVLTHIRKDCFTTLWVQMLTSSKTTPTEMLIRKWIYIHTTYIKSFSHLIFPLIHSLYFSEILLRRILTVNCIFTYENIFLFSFFNEY